MNWRDAFPTFDPATMPTIPAGFEDTSSREDDMPSFHNRALGLKIWIDHADPGDREDEDDERFVVTAESGKESEPVLLTDDWSEVEQLIAAETAAKDGTDA